LAGRGSRASLGPGPGPRSAEYRDRPVTAGIRVTCRVLVTPGDRGRPELLSHCDGSDFDPTLARAPSLRHEQIKLRLYSIVLISIDYTHYRTIIYDHFRLFSIILLQKPKRLLYAIIAFSPKRRLFHLLHYDYFTYLFRHIYYCTYCEYTRLCSLFLSQAILRIILFEMNYCDYCF
jgi:hypothetical protein